MRPIENVLDRLKNVKRNGKQWVARCPSHDDHENSLSIGEGRDRRVLLKCFAGCSVKQIVLALGLTMADLFEQRNGTGGRGGGQSSRNRFEHSNTEKKPSKKQTLSSQADGGPSSTPFEDSNPPLVGLTLAQYADAKQLPVAWLQNLGLSDISYLGHPAIRILYRDSSGTEIAVRFRLALAKSKEGDNRFRWKSGTKPCLYGLWQVEQAKAERYIVLTEGESDCHTLWFHDIPALGMPGASNWQEERDVPHLDDIPTIYMIIEPDTGGETIKRWLASSRIRDRVKLVDLGEHKDPSGLYLADPNAFLARWQASLEAAIPWIELDQKQRTREADEAYALAKELLNDPHLLERIKNTMAALGYAGDLTPPLLGYVAITSRLLERPLNLAYIAPSAAGKNRAVDAALQLIPPEAMYLAKAGSPRALIYSEEDFQHRVVVFAEADSIPEDGPAASAIRSLVEDNFMTYVVTEKNPRTGRFETRHITKPGPSGLITTSTRSLQSQLGTRVLEIPLSDAVEQTRKVMLAHARSVLPAKGSMPDLAPFLALQRWLVRVGPCQVAVPFSKTLAALVPANAVRMRRDFRQLLTCIQAMALLFQCQRHHTHEGWIEATIEDYAHARALLAPVFDMIAVEGVTPAIRQTVEAVHPGEEVAKPC
ncbi:MAG: hypothetical protein HY731_12055 [Candidatus Tectomicrobia bacterium]|nr:hypothetical protein [Candidatus Tectomicrobia bacterium]